MSQWNGPGRIGQRMDQVAGDEGRERLGKFLEILTRLRIFCVEKMLSH